MTNDKWKMISKSETIDHSSLRILLWDLDGTLVRGARYGIFKDYTVPMLESVFGTAGCLHEMIVSGMTDLQIVEEALRGEGITREQISARKDELQSCYLAEMKRATGNGAHVIEAMPGAREVLQRVHEHPRYLSALLTGNIKPAHISSWRSPACRTSFNFRAHSATSHSIGATFPPLPPRESTNI